jgi:nitrite reductase (NADH) small subunit
VSTLEFRVGPIGELAVGEGRAYAVAGEQVAVFLLRDGTVRAVSAVCPHAGGPIADGQVDGTHVLCPLHLNAFELATGRSSGGLPPLCAYPVRVDGAGDVHVTLGGPA